MSINDFSYYGDTPWVGVDKKELPMAYDPILLREWRTMNVYNQFIRAERNIASSGARTMTVTRSLDPHPNFDQLGLRQMWTNSMHFDSEAVEITFARYGGKVAYHREDNLVTYWRQNGGNGGRGIVPILQSGLSQHMVEVHDYLARNAYLSGSFKLFQGGGSDFSAIATGDTITTDTLMDIHLGMQMRGVPFAIDPSSPTNRNLVAITSPGVLHDMRKLIAASGGGDEFIDVMKYADPGRLLNYEVGTWQNMRFISTPRAILYNCGAITEQWKVILPVNAGDGAAATVDSVRKPGQSNARQYLQLESGALTGSAISADDIITIHVNRTSANGISNGVDYEDGKLHNRRVISVDAATDRITLDRPIMEDFVDDLDGSGVYAWVTLGRHIHTTTIVGGADGIMLGVAQRPAIWYAAPVDDFQSMHRWSWDAFEGYNVFNPLVFETIVSAGSFRFKGSTVVQ